MTGDVCFIAIVVNSRDTQIFDIDDMRYFCDTSRPASPTSSGMTTVNPASTTSSAKRNTAGVIPGIS